MGLKEDIEKRISDLETEKAKFEKQVERQFVAYDVSIWELKALLDPSLMEQAKLAQQKQVGGPSDGPSAA